MPIPLALIPLIASGVGAASKGAMAAYQNKMANKVAKPRPTYTRPKEAVLAQGLAENAYNSAGDTRLEEQAIDNTTQNAAYQLGNSGNSSATNMAMIAAINANANRAKVEATLNGRQRKDQMRGQLSNQLNQNATYSDKEFQVNKFEPYQNAALAAQQLKSAAGKNMEGAIKDLIAGGLNAASGGLTSKLNPTIAGSLGKFLEKGDSKAAVALIKENGFSEAQAGNVIKEIMGVTSPLAGGNMIPNIGEVKTPTNPELLNSALPKNIQMPSVLNNSLKTSNGTPLLNADDTGIGKFTPSIGTPIQKRDAQIEKNSLKTSFPDPVTIEGQDVQSPTIESVLTPEDLVATEKAFGLQRQDIEDVLNGKTTAEAVFEKYGGDVGVKFLAAYKKGNTDILSTLTPQQRELVSKLFPLLVRPTAGKQDNSYLNSLIPVINNK